MMCVFRVRMDSRRRVKLAGLPGATAAAAAISRALSDAS